MISNRPHVLLIVLVIFVAIGAIFASVLPQICWDNNKKCVDVKDFGAKGDGINDDSTAIQNAANTARDKKLTLLIPAGNYYIARTINIRSSVDCQGKIIVPNSTSPFVNIARSVGGVNISPTTLIGLDRGSTKIGGLSGYAGGTLLLRSTEILIKRDNAYEPYFTKNETAVISGSDGTIFPGLDCSYTDKAQLTVTAYPYDAPIIINGLTVKAIGDSGGGGSSCLIQCKRSNVVFNNLDLKNTSTAVSPYYGINVVECNNITFNNPTVTNIHHDYGIALNKCANTVVNNGYITGCAHAITGRHSKNVSVNGGYYSKVIDCHWGHDYVIDGATIEGSGVMYAGTDITVKNCNFPSCSGGLLIVREDTPELMGKVIYENIAVKGTNVWNLFGVGYGDWKTYIDYGRELKSPDLISVTNIVADVATTCNFSVIKLPTVLSKTNNVAPIGKIYTGNISTKSGLGNIVLGF